jgi:uncharacterized surface protein with fasciclin (FAS1) repeats
MKKIHKLALAGAALALVFGVTAYAPAPSFATEMTKMVGGAEMYPSKNIVQNAVNSKDHTTLVAAVKAAGLVPTLESKGPFTVFAPTNQAFAKLPAGTVDTLLKKRGDLALAFGILTILVVLILPLPSIVLDLFLAISITLSILILMTSLFIQAPLEFSSFPTVLLISTMLRLSLNLASTRLILSRGHEGTDAAGHVIEAFGNFVMGGNFVIGIIVFAILVIVNFVVITKGSGRIAEVAARFHLDAMPGKQMAIDADLSAG